MIKKRRGREFDSQELIDDPDWFQTVFQPGALLVLDECWRFWPSGLKPNRALEQHREFFAIEVYLLTQDLSQIASFVRLLVDKTFRAQKLDAVGMDKRYRVDVFQGAVSGPNPPISKRLREIHGKYDSQVYRLYRSHTMSQTGSALDETRTDQRYNILKGPRLKVYAVLIVLCPILAIWGASHLVGKFFGSEPEQLRLRGSTSRASLLAANPATTTLLSM
ncbi:zonular occludens toxin domain-containing protein [Microbulbifer echini]|uniref:Zonular occludens toxin domain-containing protein n=1 Tax=Microbulbifer echini TaxID=1529067 RepID=A0ABV4NSF0_9GAMM